jgi:hypothetical protein
MGDKHLAHAMHSPLLSLSLIMPPAVYCFAGSTAESSITTMEHASQKQENKERSRRRLETKKNYAV